jgi:BirA family transcriptional regulator, biotin operon repressor / biotin---[acetyl-CoA-carboxylase] ligase
VDAKSSFDTAKFHALRRDRGLRLGEPLRALDVTGSTNDDAMEAARAGAPHGATFVADLQTKGRGRRGTSWSSPSGENLLCSVLLRPALDPERAGTLTLAVGLAARDVAASRLDVPVLVKWPNDLIAGERKLAGILLESQLAAGKVEAIVVGVGLNLLTREFPADIPATSLAALGGRDVERESVLVDLLAALEQRLAVHEARGLAAVLDELRAHDALIGRRVRVEERAGIARGIAESGALLLEDAAGALHALTAGSVAWI